MPPITRDCQGGVSRLAGTFTGVPHPHRTPAAGLAHGHDAPRADVIADGAMRLRLINPVVAQRYRVRPRVPVWSDPIVATRAAPRRRAMIPTTAPAVRGSLLGAAFWVTLLMWAASAMAASTDVPTYHADAARSGHYPAAGLSWAAAANLKPDPGFDGRVPGHVYAQPLFWQPPDGGPGLVIVATEDDVVAALDAANGKIVWQTRVGTPVPAAALPCSNIDPLGITGTPVIDPAQRAVFFDATVAGVSGPRQDVFGLRLSDGAVLPGWPVDVGVAMTARGVHFAPLYQNQRTALGLLDGHVLVGFGGETGDCGDYHGTVIGVATTPPLLTGAWVSRGRKAGIWSPGGMSVADDKIYFTTGNSDRSANPTAPWDDGIGAFRETIALAHSTDPRDFFAPRDYATDDDEDLDLGASTPLPVDLPRGVRRLIAMGKDGNAYLLDRDNLGGIGGALAVRHVADGAIIQAPVVYRAKGDTLVALRSAGVICPDGHRTTAVLALAISPAGMRPVWCAPVDGRGIPIVTTMESGADPVVWVVGAEGDERLHGFRGDTGQAVVASDKLPGLRHFVTPIVADGRLYVAADGRVFAFRWDLPALSAQQ
jgi:outer membrane protein assembly factor BamB